MSELESAEANGETELTMCDVLEEEQELEEDANAVLGGSDDTNCSYDEGYVPRQALYACTTCTDGKISAGICLACCYACHDGHEVIELYTKRNFRCDCGNSKFEGKRCNLIPNKDPENLENKYNQNFKGLYCKCHRPYPDMDDNTPDEMIQCVMCEDWYHSRHLGAPVPNSDDYSEMICDQCMESHDFLYSYYNILDPEIDVGVDSLNDHNKNANSAEEKFSHNSTKIEVKTEENDASNSISEVKKEISNGISELNKSDIFFPLAATSKMAETKFAENGSKERCILETIKAQATSKIISGPAFLRENWRKELCKCANCMELYKKTNCLFLLKLDDTIHAYEERGKCKPCESQYDKGLTALSQMDRVKQMEAIHAYTNMKGELKEYLREFAENKRTVCERDITEFFDRIKKRKLNSGVPHFCH